MAGEWINRDTGLRSHPAILHLWLHFEKKHHKGLLADCVAEMWAYADQFGHVDGDDIVCELTLEMLDVHVDLPGFGAALVKYRENRTDKKPWIVVEGECLRFPKLYAVMDSSSKRRAESREKKKRERAARRNKKEFGASVPDLSRDKVGTVPQVSRDTQRTAPPQQNTEHRQQTTEHHHHHTPPHVGGGGGEEADERRKALREAGINPGPVLEELAATNLRPSQIAVIAQRVKSNGGKGGVVVNALREAATKPPDERKPIPPRESAPEPPVDPEAEKQRLRAKLETASGAARRMFEDQLRKLEGAA